MGERSVAHFLFLILITPCVVNSMPLRPLRVGITQSNMSMPRPIHSRIFHGVPTPIKYLGLFSGRCSQQRLAISYITASGSPTLKPPIAFPAACFETTYSQDATRRSLYVLPCTIGNKSCPYPYRSS